MQHSPTFIKRAGKSGAMPSFASPSVLAETALVIRRFAVAQAAQMLGKLFVGRPARLDPRRGCEFADAGTRLAASRFPISGAHACPRAARSQTYVSEWQRHAATARRRGRRRMVARAA